MSTPDGSLGLGLYIAREIAIAHGGQIEARSDNTETVFAVRLPRRR
jgi:signal transduction histidine kinase